jgi:hypothetical protein
MAKTKQKLRESSRFPRVKSDDPIYSSGYIMLRPVRGSKQESPSEEAVDTIDPGDADQEASNS